MSGTASRSRAAWWAAVGALAALLVVGALLLAVIWPPPRPASWGFVGFQGILGAAMGSMGVLITYRRPQARAGWILLLVALATAVQFVLDLGPQLVVTLAGEGTTMEVWASWISNWAWIPSVTMLGYFLLVYPDGHPPNGRWSRIGTLLLIASLGTITVASLSPGGLYNYPDVQNPVGIPGLPSEVFFVAYPVFMGSIGLTGLSLVARWRRAEAIVQAQLKWLALAGLPLVGTMIASVLFQPLEYATIGFGVLMPVTIAVAILRDRLFEIDRIISRSISWAIVTAALAAAFVGLVLVLQAVLAGITQGQTLAVAASTLLAFALFQPVRSRVQLAVDRRFDRARFDAEQMVEGFAGRLRAEVDLPAVRRNLEVTAARAVRPVAVGVWTRWVEANMETSRSGDLGVGTGGGGDAAPSGT